MKCADCERIDHLLHEETVLWIAMPTVESLRRVDGLCVLNRWPLAAIGTKGLRIDLARSEVDRFVTGLYGELKGPELAEMRVVPTDGREPGPKDLGRVMGAMSSAIGSRRDGWSMPSRPAATPPGSNRSCARRTPIQPVRSPARDCFACATATAQ